MTAPPRNTRQRNAIREIFEHASRPLSPQEVLDRGRKAVPNMSLATVYRTLTVLLDEGILTRVELPGQAPLYESALLKHHHHFHCEICGRTYDIEGCPGDLSRLVPPGFELIRHDLTLFGHCAACRAEDRR